MKKNTLNLIKKGEKNFLSDFFKSYDKKIRIVKKIAFYYTILYNHTEKLYIF